MLLIPNCRFIHPFTEEIEVTVIPNDSNVADENNVKYPLLPSRPANHYSINALDTTTITLPWTPMVKAWVEIYLDGIRIIDITTDFELNYNPYTIEENVITFTDSITGLVDVYTDTTIDPWVRPANIILMDNIQGGDTTATQPDQTYAATWCEPVVCAQPYNGYAKLSDDRKSIIYVPNQFFVGGDSFSYALMSQRGQLSKPVCIYITVAPPTP